MTKQLPQTFKPAPAKINGPKVVRDEQKRPGEVDTVAIGRFIAKRQDRQQPQAA